MGLIDKKSNLDRNTQGDAGELGPNVGTTLPSDGTYHTGTPAGSSTSPFGVTMGGKSDQMVTLLENAITTTTSINGTPNTYLPSPNQSPYQDLNLPDMANHAGPSKYTDNQPG
jgi:hypothetical protein|tara:strand:+ start:280 stop:618 length:339 start_codon:yes stop_codon:yes gene_type:complete